MNINLLPWRERQQKQLFFQFLLINICCIATVMVTIIGIHITMTAQRRTVFLNYLQLQTRLNQLPHQSRQQMKFWQQLQRERHHTLLAIFAIVQALPHDCYLTKLQYHHHWLLKGYAPHAALVNDFIHHLQQNRLFLHIQLTSMTKQQLFIFVINIT